VRAYIVDITEATRSHPDVYLGASPRASLMLLRGSRALAASAGRDYVVPDDVKTLAAPVLSHRMIVSADAAMSGHTPESLLRQMLEEVPVPVKG
jgi:MoxR-like ATPase